MLRPVRAALVSPPCSPSTPYWVHGYMGTCARSASSLSSYVRPHYYLIGFPVITRQLPFAASSWQTSTEYGANQVCRLSGMHQVCTYSIHK